jgi:hypothetical protein
MWIDWKNGLLNLCHAKRVYIEQRLSHIQIENFSESELSESIEWILKIVFQKNEGEYVQIFDNEEDALREYEKIRQRLFV